MLSTARAVEARCSQAGRSDLRCYWSLRWRPNFFSSCPALALPSSLCSICSRRPPQPVCSVAWRSLSFLWCFPVGLHEFRLTSASKEDSMSGRMSVFFRSVLPRFSTCCGARKHQPICLFWPVGCLILKVCSFRLSSLLRLVPRPCQGPLQSFDASFIHKNVGATLTYCVFALENAILSTTMLSKIVLGLPR